MPGLSPGRSMPVRRPKPNPVIIECSGWSPTISAALITPTFDDFAITSRKVSRPNGL